MINIILLIVLFIVLYLMYYFKKEYFIINSKNDDERKQVLKTFDETAEVLNFNLNEIDITSPLIDAYLDEKILDKKSNKETNNNDLPFMRDNNLTNYNHQLKLLINSRKISQDIILNILRNKINYLMGSLKNIKDVKKKYPSLV
jgi:hypothetical protein